MMISGLLSERVSFLVWQPTTSLAAHTKHPYGEEKKEKEEEEGKEESIKRLDIAIILI